MLEDSAFHSNHQRGDVLSHLDVRSADRSVFGREEVARAFFAAHSASFLILARCDCWPTGPCSFLLIYIEGAPTMYIGVFLLNHSQCRN